MTSLKGLTPTEMPVYDLVVAKGGPKMKEATPEEDDKAKMASSRGGEIDAVAVTMDALPWMLGEVVGRPVLNKTGLAAKYDFTLQYLPGAQGGRTRWSEPRSLRRLRNSWG